MQALKTSKKRALLIGLNYMLDVNARLNGCCNDVRNVGKYLISTCGFTSSQVDIVTDEDLRNAVKVSRDGIIDLIYGLCIASWKEDLDLAVFHYSGHGSQSKDMNGDEKDGMDEGIVPMDYLNRGLILDDFMLGIFLRFNPKTKIICFYDCCHSGSILDLPFAYDVRQTTENGMRVTKPLVNAPVIYCISGCKDEQTSADASDDTGAGAGAMTSCLLKLLGTKGQLGYPILQLQEDMNKMLLAKGFSQKSIVSSSKALGMFDNLL